MSCSLVKIFTSDYTNQVEVGVNNWHVAHSHGYELSVSARSVTTFSNADRSKMHEERQIKIGIIQINDL